MIFPAITAIFAAVLTLYFVGLSLWTVAGRVSTSVLLGSGDDALARRVRSHGNFIEYVPLALILIGLLEAGGADYRLVGSLLVILLIARLLHPIGMFAPANSPRQFACRGGGILGTITVLCVAAVALLLRAL